MISDIERWTQEVLATGQIVQDDDASVDPAESEARFNRYVELVDMVEGTEGATVCQSLIDSIQAAEDYGAYQGTLRAIFSFPAAELAASLIRGLPELIARQPEWAGDLLSSLILDAEEERPERITAFNDALRRLTPEMRSQIATFIREQEADGWLADYNKVGVLAPE